MNQKDLAKILKSEFSSNEEEIRFFSAPGRINIIGEHVDYAGGIVLPAAIDFSIRIAIRKNKNESLEFIPFPPEKKSKRSRSCSIPNVLGSITSME